jgi:hypothetical protein
MRTMIRPKIVSAEMENSIGSSSAIRPVEVEIHEVRDQPEEDENDSRDERHGHPAKEDDRNSVGARVGSATARNAINATIERTRSRRYILPAVWFMISFMIAIIRYSRRHAKDFFGYWPRKRASGDLNGLHIANRFHIARAQARIEELRGHRALLHLFPGIVPSRNPNTEAVIFRGEDFEDDGDAGTGFDLKTLHLGLLLLPSIGDGGAKDEPPPRRSRPPYHRVEFESGV